ncbi:MAG: rhodanese-like domain-containing protein [Chloroflexi bacterium]|nr:rhodanese-like domain-containing protein [Chloroflexota bacterium]
MSVEAQEPFKRIFVEEAKRLIDSGVPVIDVRELGEYQNGHVPGAKLVPLNSFLRDASKHLPAQGPVIFVCAVGQRSAVASEMAAAVGATEVYNVEGGTKAWIAKGYPIDR